MFNVFVKNTATGDIFELPYISISFTEELNAGKDAKFSFDYLAVKDIADKYNTSVLFLFTAGLREIYIEKNGTKVYLGVVTDYTLGKDNLGNLKLDIASVGFMSLFNKRRTGAKRVFSSTDAGTIAWTLIDESQTSDNPYSDFGITQGSIQTSKNRDRTFRFASIKQEIEQMSNNNLKDGYDSDIDNSKKFNVYYPIKGSTRPTIILDDKNILSWGFRKPLILSLANSVYVLGEGFNDDILYVKRTSPADYRSTFKLLEEVLSARDIITSDTLNDQGDRYLLDNQAPIVQLTVIHPDDEPDIGTYEVGDSIKIKIDELSINQEYRRVLKRTVNIDQQGAAIVTLAVQ